MFRIFMIRNSMSRESLDEKFLKVVPTGQ